MLIELSSPPSSVHYLASTNADLAHITSKSHLRCLISVIHFTATFEVFRIITCALDPSNFSNLGAILSVCDQISSNESSQARF
jgi:hypothetical protein